MPINATHDASIESWVESANDPASDFPIQNLPLCSFEVSHDDHSHEHIGVLIGDQVLDIGALLEANALNREEHEEVAYVLGSMNWALVASVPGMMSRVRGLLQWFLRADTQMGQQLRRARRKALIPMSEARFVPAMAVGGYTDFYASVHHATNVGSMFRPDNPLLPNYKHVPIGYHGRASSIVVSGTEIRRPRGQQSPPDGEPGAPPSFGPCKMLDYELEIGAFIAPGNRMGEPIAIKDARSHIAGLCLLNDWSARDIQKWEYQPLGPFLAKNFATTVSPSIVTLEALEPFRARGYERADGDPAPLEYLRDGDDAEHGGFDIKLEVLLRSREMRERGLSPARLSLGDFGSMFWSFAQMIAHHTSNGCNLEPGDLLGSGTISGREASSRGCLLELTWRGLGPDKKPLPRRAIELPTGETRTFLADGDEVIFRGWCEREGFRRIGFGECRGTIVSAD